MRLVAGSLILLFLFAALPAAAQTPQPIRSKVTTIFDGDTLALVEVMADRFARDMVAVIEEVSVWALAPMKC